MPLESRQLQSSGLSYAIRLFCGHKLVVSAIKKSQETYKSIVEITRKGELPALKAYVADIYILTASDVNELLYCHPEIDCIVVISNWNHYTYQAKQMARDGGVGVFTLNEFLEALNYCGDDFLDTGNASKIE